MVIAGSVDGRAHQDRPGIDLQLVAVQLDLGMERLAELAVVHDRVEQRLEVRMRLLVGAALRLLAVALLLQLVLVLVLQRHQLSLGFFYVTSIARRQLVFGALDQAEPRAGQLSENEAVSAWIALDVPGPFGVEQHQERRARAGLNDRRRWIGMYPNTDDWRVVQKEDIVVRVQGRTIRVME